MSSELFRKYIDMINEAEEGGPADIQQVATQLKFLPTHKKDLTYTQLTVNALKNNELASESDLHIYSDGPKNITAEPLVKKVRDFIKTIKH